MAVSIESTGPDMEVTEPLRTYNSRPVTRVHEAEPDVFVRLDDVPGHRKEPLAHARILAVGLGGLNTWTAMGLARSGATCFTLVEPDFIEITNLTRQPYLPEDRGKPKAFSFAENLGRQGHLVGGGTITAIARPFDESFLTNYAVPCDLLLVGVDNNRTRLLAAEWARKNRTPAIFTALSISGSFRCYAFLQGPREEDACLHCARPDLEIEDAAACAAATVAGCFAASALALFFAYRALMDWPEGLEPFNYREIDLMGEAPDARVWVTRRSQCPTCGTSSPVR